MVWGRSDYARGFSLLPLIFRTFLRSIHFHTPSTHTAPGTVLRCPPLTKRMSHGIGMQNQGKRSNLATRDTTLIHSDRSTNNHRNSLVFIDITTIIWRFKAGHRTLGSMLCDRASTQADVEKKQKQKALENMWSTLNIGRFYKWLLNGSEEYFWKLIWDQCGRSNKCTTKQ